MWGHKEVETYETGLKNLKAVPFQPGVVISKSLPLLEAS
jgi:hypothetical protein